MPTVPDIARAELRELYAQLAHELEPFRRQCDLRSICCNFAEVGHMLYLTGLEAAEMRATLDAPNLVQSGEGKCPYLRGKLCGAREHRAIGCRIYYCDRTYEDERNALCEKYLKAARAIETRHGIEHTYEPVTTINFELWRTA